MKTGFLHLHNFLAWLVLAVLVVSVLLFAVRHFSKKPILPIQNTLRLLAVILTGLQLLVGFGVYFIWDWHTRLGMMGEKAIRFAALEHPLTMLIGIALIHIGNGKLKRAPEGEQNKKGLLFFGIALLLILSRTPWDRLF
jgi:hypothetical protein